MTKLHLFLRNAESCIEFLWVCHQILAIREREERGEREEREENDDEKICRCLLYGCGYIVMKIIIFFSKITALFLWASHQILAIKEGWKGGEGGKRRE